MSIPVPKAIPTIRFQDRRTLRSSRSTRSFAEPFRIPGLPVAWRLTAITNMDQIVGQALSIFEKINTTIPSHTEHKATRPRVLPLKPRLRQVGPAAVASFMRNR